MSEAKHTPIFPYRVTRDGRVFSIDFNWRGYGDREMTVTPNSDGYPSVGLTIDGKRRRRTIHSLVASLYLPARPSPAHEIRHLDGDKNNNFVENLAWGTRKDNAHDRERHGRTSRGESHSMAIRCSTHSANVRRGDMHYKRIRI